MKKLIALLTLGLAFAGGAQAIEVDTNAAVAAMQQPGTLLVDVRTPEEYDGGAIDGAINIPYDEIAQDIDGVAPDKEQTIVVYCRSGRRADIASDTLLREGYRNVINGGGYQDLKSLLELTD